VNLMRFDGIGVGKSRHVKNQSVSALLPPKGGTKFVRSAACFSIQVGFLDMSIRRIKHVFVFNLG